MKLAAWSIVAGISVPILVLVITKWWDPIALYLGYPFDVRRRVNDLGDSVRRLQEMKRDLLDRDPHPSSQQCIGWLNSLEDLQHKEENIKNGHDESGVSYFAMCRFGRQAGEELKKAGALESQGRYLLQEAVERPHAIRDVQPQHPQHGFWGMASTMVLDFIKSQMLFLGMGGVGKTMVKEENAESKVKEKNLENIGFDRHSSSSSSKFPVVAEILREDRQRARPRSPADELVEAARGGKGGDDMMPHRRRSVSRHLWGMETYENKVHLFVKSNSCRDKLLFIWGKRGVGKSALLRLVRDSYAGGTSFDHVLFVGAGTGGCTVLNMQHAIVTSFGLDLPLMSLSEWKRAKFIRRSLVKRKERALLLVDDVREPFKLWDVGLPTFWIRHKIICATRSLTVCARINECQIIEMRCLGEDDAWNLFKDKVGIVDAQPPAHPHVHQLAKKMVAECRGLPLALCVIGRAMSSKTDPREWRNAYNLLKAKHSQIQEDEGYSYLDILENELKDSFLVTSLWPKDGSIPRAHEDMYQDSSIKDEIVLISQKSVFYW